MEKEKKTKKEFHTYKKLSLLAIMLILGGILALALAYLFNIYQPCVFLQLFC